MPYISRRVDIPDEVNLAQAEALTGLLGVVKDENFLAMLTRAPGLLWALPPEARAAFVLAAFKQARSRPQRVRLTAIGRVTDGRNASSDRNRRILLPLIRTKWDQLDRLERGEVLGQVANMLVNDASGKSDVGETKEELLAFLRAHAADLEMNAFNKLSSHPEILPRAEWLRRAPQSAVQNVQWSDAVNADADALARAWTEAPRVLRDTEWRFVRELASDDVKNALIAVMLTHEDATFRYAALTQSLGGHPGVARRGGFRPTTAILEQSLAMALAEETPDVSVVRQLTKKILPAHPSEKLFPAAKFLLASSDREAVIQGIGVADSLGREDLVDALRPLLGSMDARVRGNAKQALEAIAEVSRMKAERRK